MAAVRGVVTVSEFVVYDERGIVPDEIIQPEVISSGVEAPGYVVTSTISFDDVVGAPNVFENVAAGVPSASRVSACPPLSAERGLSVALNSALCHMKSGTQTGLLLWAGVAAAVFFASNRKGRR